MTKRGSAPKAINIAKAKARLPELVEWAAGGAEIVIAKNGKPRARLVPLAPRVTRLPGAGAGRWEIAGDFNEPLPAELLAAFEGRRK